MTLTVRLIAETAATHYGITYRDVVSHRRDRVTAHARLATYLLARQLTPCSFPTIGRALGKRDHTTVIDGARTMAARLRVDPALAADFQELTAALLAIEASIDRFEFPALPPDIDPEAVAQRVMASERGAISVTRDEVVALAAAVLGSAADTEITTATAEEPNHV